MNPEDRLAGQPPGLSSSDSCAPRIERHLTLRLTHNLPVLVPAIDSQFAAHGQLPAPRNPAWLALSRGGAGSASALW